MEILITAAAFAVLTLVLSMMVVIYKIAKDCKTHTNGYVKTTLKVFIFLFDALLVFQVVMIAMDIVKLSPSKFKVWYNALTAASFTHIFLTALVIIALSAMLIYYRNVNRKIFVASGYRLDGKELDADWQRKMEKAKAKAEKKAAKKAERIAKKIAKLEQEAIEEKGAEPSEISEIKTEPVVEEPVAEEAESELTKVVARRRKHAR